jgi:hypothetical protein
VDGQQVLRGQQATPPFASTPSTTHCPGLLFG